MEPNCAICNSPAQRRCPCEHESLILAVEQSERRVLSPMWDEIRYWVTSSAKAEIHRDFQARTAHRRAMHTKYMYQNASRFTNEMLERMNIELKRGIDGDWRVAVQRYPEVLDYYYGLVSWTMRPTWVPMTPTTAPGTTYYMPPMQGSPGQPQNMHYMAGGPPRTGRGHGPVPPSDIPTVETESGEESSVDGSSDASSEEPHYRGNGVPRPQAYAGTGGRVPPTGGQYAGGLRNGYANPQGYRNSRWHHRAYSYVRPPTYQ